MSAQRVMESIPRPPQKPVIGNLLDVSPNAPVQDLVKLARAMGPIFRLNMLGRPLTVVWGASLVDELCDETRFDKSVTRPLRNLRKVAHGLFVSATKDPNWSKAHNVLLPNFSQRAMQGYHPAMLEIAGQLSLKWQRLNADEEVDVTHEMTALTLDTIGLCGFGYRFNSFYREGNHPFVDAMVEALEISMQTRGLPLEELFGKAKERKLAADVRYMRGIVERIVRERRAARAAATSEAPPSDLLDHMLLSVDKKSAERLDDVQIREQIITFLIAGHETTSGMLSFAIYFLLRNPEVVAKARAEVDRVFGTDVTQAPTVKHVDRLVYVQQILKEALRLWPTAPAFAVQPYRDETIGGAYPLEARTNVLVLLPMLHRDPAVWGADAERFDPDHFTADAEAARPPNAFKPFGNGQRACIGQQFAMQEATLVLGTILQRFELYDPHGYTLDVRESLTIKPVGLRVRVAPRVHARPQAASVEARAPLANGTAHLPAPAASGPRHETPLLVLFGSNLGTSEEIARQLAENATALGFAATLATLDAYTGRLPTSGAVAIVSASYNGAPPDNASEFYRWLAGGEGLAPASLAGVKFAVFGAGNRNWASTYQNVPRTIDERLAAYGAERIYARGEGDAREDLEGHFEAWRAPIWPALAAAFDLELGAGEPAVERPMYELEYVAGPQPNPLALAHGATTMRLVVNRELQTKDVRSTRHLEIALPPGTTYAAGDHLGVIPSNRETLVDRVMRRFAIEPDTYVRLHTEGPQRIASLPLDATLSVRRLLKNYVELQLVASRKQIALLAEHTRCPVTKPQLLALTASDESGPYQDEVRAKRLSILDVLERFPASELPFSTYLAESPLMTPRYYSISSSPLAEPDRCSITVAVVRGEALSGEGTYEGVASTHLAARDPGDRLNVFVKPSKSGFRLPDDPLRPIVMIGPGTGLAPFRGFVQERTHHHAAGVTLGPAMLFFGCRNPEEDYLYRSDLQRAAAQGIVELHVAFSRQGGVRTYVQDLMKTHAERLWQLLQDDAVVYVCGDGSRMEPGVRATVAEIYRERTGADEGAAERWLAELGARGRYVLDVWASS